MKNGQSKNCSRFLLLLCVAACCGTAVGDEGPEVLYLRNGDRFTGHIRGVADGALQWKTEFGEDMQIPLDAVENIDFPRMSPDLDGTRTTVPELCEQSPLPAIEFKRYDRDAPPAPWESLPFYSEATTILNDAVEAASTWTKRIQLGGQFNDGNTNNNLVDVLAEFENSTDTTLRQFDSGGQFGTANRQTTVDRWWGNGNIDHTLDGKWIVFATNKNEYDQFTNLDYRGTLSAGIGYRFFNEPKKRLITRLGPAVTGEKFDTFSRITPDAFGEIETRWPLYGRTHLEQKTRVNPSLASLDLVRILSTSSILIDLDDRDRWKLRMSFRYEFNSIPSPGRVPGDYLSTVSLVYVRK